MIFLGENQGSVFRKPSMRAFRADYAHSCCGLCAPTVRTMHTDRPDRPYSCSKGFVQKNNIKVSPAPAVSLNKSKRKLFLPPPMLYTNFNTFLPLLPILHENRQNFPFLKFNTEAQRYREKLIYHNA